MSKNTILIVEDDHSIRAMLRYALEMADFQVNEAEDAGQAQICIDHAIPDLILLDWMLPSKDGIYLTKFFKNDPRTTEVPIIMLSAKAQEDHRVSGLEAGADDYVVKPFSPRELIARIRAVLRRTHHDENDGVLSVRELSIDTKSQRVSIADHPVKLGPLEYRLLCFFLTHPNRVFNRQLLLSQVWKGDTYVDERTVDVHIRRLRKQLMPGRHDTLIQTVHGSGYRFSE